MSINKIKMALVNIFFECFITCLERTEQEGYALDGKAVGDAWDFAYTETMEEVEKYRDLLGLKTIFMGWLACNIAGDLLKKEGVL